jgi:hypothetical protein
MLGLLWYSLPNVIKIDSWEWVRATGGLLLCGIMVNLRQVLVVMAVSDITLQLPWLQMIILCEVCAEVNKQLSIEHVMQHCVFCVRYKPRLKNELSKKHVI